MSENVTLELGQRLALLPWIRWGAGHLDELPGLMATISEWSAVPAIPIRPKWEITKATGDQIVPILEDAPPFNQALTLECTETALITEEARFDGSLLRAFLAALPEIIAFINWLRSQGTQPIQAAA